MERKVKVWGGGLERRTPIKALNGTFKTESMIQEASPQL